MSTIRRLSKLPVDFGQAEYKHKQKGKLIGFLYIPKPLPSATALDVGCGDGYWSEKIKGLNYLVTAIDKVREYPNKDSNQRYAQMIPINLNETLPFSDDSFDLVWCSEVIGFLKNLEQAIKEMRRVLKPGGTYIITTPNSFFWLHYFLKIFRIGNKDWHHEDQINFLGWRDIKKLFPTARIFGYFPFIFFRIQIGRFIGILSPTLVIVGKKQKETN